MVLEDEGYFMITAYDGESALQKVNDDRPDLILLDVMMPGKNGVNVCKTLKTNSTTNSVPVVMFTVLGRDVDKKITMKAGADGHFTKPFDPKKLKQEIKKYLNEARASKFCRQLGFNHNELQGKKILFEFDPTSSYDKLIRDFIIESHFHRENLILLTSKGSSLNQSLENIEYIEFVNISFPDTRLSPILQQYKKGHLTLIFDSISDLALSADPQTAYKFTRNALELLSEPRITALLLLNPSAHEPKDVQSLRGLFNNILSYNNEGIQKIRMI